MSAKSPMQSFMEGSYKRVASHDSVTKVVANFRYKFRYRDQFGLFTLRLRKLFTGRYFRVLRLFSIAVIFLRLTAILRNSKSADPCDRGGSTPPPGTN